MRHRSWLHQNTALLLLSLANINPTSLHMQRRGSRIIGIDKIEIISKTPGYSLISFNHSMHLLKELFFIAQFLLSIYIPQSQLLRHQSG